MLMNRFYRKFCIVEIAICCCVFHVRLFSLVAPYPNPWYHESDLHETLAGIVWILFSQVIYITYKSTRHLMYLLQNQTISKDFKPCNLHHSTKLSYNGRMKECTICGGTTINTQTTCENKMFENQICVCISGLINQSTLKVANQNLIKYGSSSSSFSSWYPLLTYRMLFKIAWI